MTEGPAIVAQTDGRTPVHPDMIIAGEPARATERYPVHNPANGSIVGTAPLAATDDAVRAVAAAVVAQRSWLRTAVAARADAIERGLDAVAAAKSSLAVLL